ncbi:MAG: hypothetical protein ACREML_12740, partial [Vulcanimicrobiaceae bacterium]
MPRIVLLRIAIIAISIAIWEMLARGHAFGPTLSVPPTVMFATMIAALMDGRLIPDVGRTVLEVALAYGIALLVGLPLGVVLWRSRLLATAIEPYLLAYYVI